jgi:hypothetical protein
MDAGRERLRASLKENSLRLAKSRSKQGLENLFRDHRDFEPG